MKQFTNATLGVAISGIIALGQASAADLPKEAHVIDGKPLPVTSKTELTFGARQDADVKTRELWYAKRAQNNWGAWQKHGIVFGRNDPIVWAVPEGTWKIAIRIEEISGLPSAQPGPDSAGDTSFIVDRTAPAVTITGPAAGTKMSGGKSYPITWKATDPHLHSTPITIQWSRSADGAFETIAEALPNQGSFDWTAPRDMTATGRIRILASDKAGNTGSNEIGSLVVDAIAPRTNVLGPTISATKEVNLAVSAREAGPAGMRSITLWYSSDGGGSWTEGPKKTAEPWDSLAWNAPADGNYLLNLVAEDQSGNTSTIPGAAANSQGSLLIDTEQPALTLSSAIGIQDAAAGSDAPIRRVYKPGDQVVVNYQVKDSNLPKDAISVFIQLEKGADWQQLASGLAPNAPYNFSLPNVNSDSVRVKVQALDLAGNLGEVVAGETFRIDNVVETGTVTVDFD